MSQRIPPAPIRAVTFDFWNTLVDGRATPVRTAERMSRLHDALTGAGHTGPRGELEAAFHRALRRVRLDAKETFRDVGPQGRWLVLAEELGITPDRIPFSVVEQAYDEITLSPLPALTPDVGTAVRALADRGYRLAVVCNTGMAGGRILREVLRAHDLLPLFTVTIWSDEFGLSKPHPEIFHRALNLLQVEEPGAALHVGDLEALDVAGAHQAGLHAALYAPDGGAAATEADLVVSDWEAFPDQLAAYAGSSSSPPDRHGSARM